MIITWLSAVLRGDCPEWPFDDGFDLELIVEVAHHEGVVALLYDRLLVPQMIKKLPAGFARALSRMTQTKVAQSLFREAHCRSILVRLNQIGIPVLLLKGSALAYWAYASPYLRECCDIDLLFRSRADVDSASRILEELHFELRDRELPGDLVSFEITCVGSSSANLGLEIDLHWQLSSSPMFAFRFNWDELHAGSIELAKLAVGARGIATSPAFVHACMHRAQNMVTGCADRLKWLFDLVLLGKRFGAHDWDAVVDLAIQRGLASVCVDGIQAASARFGNFAPQTAMERLAAAAIREPMDVKQLHRWWYIQRMNLVAFPSMGQRLRWLRQRLVPDSAYRRARYGEHNAQWRSLAARFRAGIERFISR